jgi:hypothetical protein
MNFYKYKKSSETKLLLNPDPAIQDNVDPDPQP